MTEPFSIGTVATFTCNDDYTLNGATATLTCADDNQADTLGTWGGSEPSCLGKAYVQTIKLYITHLIISPAAIECSALTASTNGRVSYSTDMTEPFSIGTVATFTCDDDYTLNGATATLTCADDNQADTLGTWGGSEPSCLGKSIHAFAYCSPTIIMVLIVKLLS